MRFKTVTGLGGHPELGDVVYDGETELGEVEFFYYQVDKREWAVKVKNYAIDPVEVILVDIPSVSDPTLPAGRYLKVTQAATGKNTAHDHSALGPGKTRVNIVNNA